jgi:diguanylate cyclase (GGDEF)-like protein/PAS domain S-box-containing protein
MIYRRLLDIDTLRHNTMTVQLPVCTTAGNENLKQPSLDLLLRNLPGAVYRCKNDLEWTMEFLSDEIESITGYPAGAFTAEPRLAYASLIHPEDVEKVRGAIDAAIAEEASFQVVYRLTDSRNEIRWIWEQGCLSNSQIPDGQVIEGYMADITRMRTAEIFLQERASYLERARDAIVVMEMDSRITYWNKGAEKLYGWSESDAVGKLFCDFICATVPSFAHAREATARSGEWAGELTHRRHDGIEVDVETSWTLLAADESLGIPQKILMISADICERKEHLARIHKLAFFDALTELPNRVHFLEQLRHALAASSRSSQFGSLLFCDLDNFKLVNDSQGHATGDMLLQAVAKRLRSCVRETDMVARLGGDEFVVLLYPSEQESSSAAAQAEAVASKIVKAMSGPINAGDKILRSSASIGISIFDGKDSTTESVLLESDMAMYEAKTAGRSTFRFHDPAIQAQWSARAVLEDDLLRALNFNEFVLHYQPQIEGKDTVVGAEALLRWRLPNGKVVYPNEFIKAAEETHLIVEIGSWVLRTACSQLAAWQGNPATAMLTLSVNVSARQFTTSGFVESLEEIFKETGVNPAFLKLELTENLLIHDFQKTADVMGHLKKRGICFSLDDFGTGYSSLAYLRKLPIDQLKIDHSFMRDVLTNQGDASIVRSIIGLAVNLGLQVIAEGVETTGQRDFLSNSGCNFYQGFLYNHALTADLFTEYANRYH